MTRRPVPLAGAGLLFYYPSEFCQPWRIMHMLLVGLGEVIGITISDRAKVRLGRLITMAISDKADGYLGEWVSGKNWWFHQPVAIVAKCRC